MSRTFLAALAAVVSTTGAPHPEQVATAARSHAAVLPSEIAWKPLRPGAEIAVVSGDPDKAGAPFVMRMRYQGVVRVPPHWHPTDEHITVLTGTFMMGMGERFDESSAIALVAGAYAHVPAK